LDQGSGDRDGDMAAGADFLPWGEEPDADRLPGTSLCEPGGRGPQLGGDGLHQGRGDGVFADDDARDVAAKPAGREGVVQLKGNPVLLNADIAAPVHHLASRIGQRHR
jgi:hypothetical protein